MPFTKLALGSLEIQTQPKHQVINQILKYLAVESSVSNKDYLKMLIRGRDEKLEKQKQQLITPLREWFSSTFRFHFPRDATEDNREAAYKNKPLIWFFTSLDNWTLHGIDHLTGLVKSLVLSLALQQQQISAIEALRVSRIEEESQISGWGELPVHREERLVETVGITAVSVFFKFLELERTNVVETTSKSNN